MADDPRDDAVEAYLDRRFQGHLGRDCGEHHTTGKRAWCFDCHEWCYPSIPCNGCQRPAWRLALPKVARAWTTIDDRLTALIGDPVQDGTDESEVAQALHTIAEFIANLEAGL